MAVYFFSKSYTYERGVSASSSGGTDVYDPSEALDYDMSSYWENDSALPELIIDLGSVQTIDCLFMKEAMITTFKLYHSDDAISWSEVVDGTNTEKEAGIWWWLSFTEVSKQYWKIEVTAKGASNVKIYEVMLMELRLALTDNIDLPSMVRMPKKDTIGGAYPLVDGSHTSYAGERDYAEIDIEFQNIDSDAYDNLYTLWTTPSLRYPLVVIPDDDKPSYIYRCVWREMGFDFDYHSELKLSGLDGVIKLMEY